MNLSPKLEPQCSVFKIFYNALLKSHRDITSQQPYRLSLKTNFEKKNNHQERVTNFIQPFFQDHNNDL